MLADPENLLEVLLEIYYCGAPSDPPHTHVHTDTHTVGRWWEGLLGELAYGPRGAKAS